MDSLRFWVYNIFMAIENEPYNDGINLRLGRGGRKLAADIDLIFSNEDPRSFMERYEFKQGFEGTSSVVEKIELACMVGAATVGITIGTLEFQSLGNSLIEGLRLI